jgi:uncharacterized integral membrane protein
MKRMLWWLLVVPFGAILVAMAVANRRLVTVSLDPFRPDAPLIGLEMPLFFVIFATLIVGILIGGTVVWFKQGRFRRQCRIAEGDAARWRSEAARADDRLKAAGLAPSLAPALTGPSGRRAA